MNIRKRLILFGTLWIVLCAATLIGFLSWHTQRALLNSAAERGEALTYELAKAIESDIFSGDIDQVEHEIQKIILGDIIGVLLTFDSYKYSSKITLSSYIDLDTPVGKSSKLIQVENKKIIRTEITTFQENKSPLSIWLFLDADPIYERTTEIMWRSIFILVPMVMIFLFLGWILSGKMVRPLDRLSSYIVFNNKFRPKELTSLPIYKPKTEIDLIYISFKNLEKTLEQKAKDLQAAQIQYKKDLETATNEFEKKNFELAKQIETHNKLLLLLSHEVRTPIAALSLHISNLFNSIDHDVSKEQAAKIENIKSLAQRIFSLIESVLRFSLKENDPSNINRKIIELRPTVERVVFSLEGFSKKMNVKCALDASLNNKSVFVNADHLEQILINLVHNAVKQSPPGSTIFLSADSEDEFIQFYVTDSGFGIDESLKEEIFKNPVRSEGRQSNGVGLFICHYLVELNSGSIWFKDNEPQGTTFVLKFQKNELINAKVLGRENIDGNPNSNR